MTPDIIAALNACRTVGQDFTRAFNNLAEQVEFLLLEHDDQRKAMDRKNDIIKGHEEALIQAKLTQDSTYARATKAEEEAWTLAQTLERTKADLGVAQDKCHSQGITIGQFENELAELRPLGQLNASLKMTVDARDATITQLRSEVSKLLEIILTVATSVDGVVNKPKPDEDRTSTQVMDNLVIDPTKTALEVSHTYSYPRAVGA